jgi:hypothetical protein
MPPRTYIPTPPPTIYKFLIHVILRGGERHVCHTVVASPDGALNCHLKGGGVRIVEPHELWDMKYLPEEQE